MLNYTTKEYNEYKKYYESLEINSISLPTTKKEWLFLSQCDNLTYDFICEHKDNLSLEYIILNPNLRFRNAIAQKFQHEINWTKVALILAYRKQGTEEDALTTDLTNSYKLLNQYSDIINWDKLTSTHFQADINNNFLIYFYSHLNWTDLFNNVYNHIDSNIINGVDAKGYLDWDQISQNTHFPDNFLIENKELINWDIFLQNNNLSDIPIECLSYENLLQVIKNNPDLLYKLSDKGSYGLSSDFLRGKFWIDRVSDGLTHFADDSTIADESLLIHKWLDRTPSGNLHFDDEKEYTYENTSENNIHFIDDFEEEYEL